MVIAKKIPNIWLNGLKGIPRRKNWNCSSRKCMLSSVYEMYAIICV